jgi:hypothetical protein
MYNKFNQCFSFFCCAAYSGFGVRHDRNMQIEVKFTERSSSVNRNSQEYKKANNKDSRYWQVTRNSGCFIDGGKNELASNNLRQLWRNHLLGLSMVEKGIINNFYLVIFHPKGNTHISEAIHDYKKYIVASAEVSVIGCSYEHFINSIEENGEIHEWKDYLIRRYFV